MYKSIFIFISFCVSFYLSKANNDIVLFDPLNNDSLVIATSKMVFMEGKKFNRSYDSNEEVQLVTPEIISPIDSIIRKKINKRIFEILKGQKLTDSFNLKLAEDFQRSLSTYISVYSNIKDPYEVINSHEFFPVPGEMKYEFSLCCRNILTLISVLNYEFNILEETMQHIYCETYYFDLTTGKEYRPKDVFNPASENNVNTIIEKIANENIKGIAMKIEEKEFQQYAGEDEFEIKKNTQPAPKKLVDFSVMDEGFIFPKVFSMAYFIPAWSPSTKNIYGTQITVRLPFDTIKLFLNPNGPFAYLINYSLPDSTFLTNVNQPSINYRGPEQNYVPETEIPGFDIAPKYLPGQIKTIRQFKLSDKRNEKGILEGNMLLYREFFYSEMGLLKEIHFYDENQIQSGRYLYSYNQKNNIIKFSDLCAKENVENEYPDRVSEYIYDSKNNLKFLTSRESSDLIYANAYLYADHFSLMETYSKDNPFENFCEKITMNKNGLVISINNIYDPYYGGKSFYDGNNRPLCYYSINENGALSGSLYTYDKIGNLISFQFDNEQKFIEFEFNEKGKLIHETRFEWDSRRIYYEKKVEYNSEN